MRPENVVPLGLPKVNFEDHQYRKVKKMGWVSIQRAFSIFKLRVGTEGQGRFYSLGGLRVPQTPPSPRLDKNHNSSEPVATVGARFFSVGPSIFHS